MPIERDSQCRIQSEEAGMDVTIADITYPLVTSRVMGVFQNQLVHVAYLMIQNIFRTLKLDQSTSTLLDIICPIINPYGANQHGIGTAVYLMHGWEGGSLAITDVVCVLWKESTTRHHAPKVQN